jgi:thiol-disulfide isomerase/thioredoxin
MDLNQQKLTKTEWDTTEITVPMDEKEILNLIIKGYHDVNIIYNKNTSIINYLKLTPTDSVMNHLHKEYFQPIIEELQKKYEFPFESKHHIKIHRMNSIEKLKLENLSKTIQDCGKKLFEFYLLHITEQTMRYFYKDNTTKFNKYYYTLHHLMKLKITNVIPQVTEFIEAVLANYSDELNREDMFLQSSDLIEQNEDLVTYKDIHLYDHQKQLFTIAKTPNPKLVLYIAPTGTGKTLSPLGLSETHRVIFVCAARHVGLALAKSAISMGKKIAFAFGCNDVSDIRLHYFAAKDYVKHNKTGKDIKYRDGSKKVDNTVGDNVEIMICDIKSYLCAMYYMNAFNRVENMIMYWDEPTITMDYTEHEFHSYISDNWQKNIIPNIILSSATLPHQEDLQETIADFTSRFENSLVYNIVSHDCNKSIPLLNTKNEVEMPHLKYEDYDKLQESVNHCKKYKTLLRYFDLSEIVKFIHYLNKMDMIQDDRYKIAVKYENLSEMTMNNIKLHYLDLLEQISREQWTIVYQYFRERRVKKFESNIHIATTDAHTLTDGPTIFLADDVEKISKFILQSAKIPEQVIDDMMTSIEHNDKVLKVLKQKEQQLEDSIGDEAEKEHKMTKDRITPEQRSLRSEIDGLYKLVKTIALNELFVPNKLAHMRRWIQKDLVEREFSCNIEPYDVEKIMLMEVKSSWKILLLMGIGVFTNNHDNNYTEIMKQLAVQQKLYLIIASSDYIYGTNYQFCHGYISKDLGNMTQEKTIQALGRIGRNQLNKEYSIRFRDDSLIEKIFVDVEHRPEVENMNRLFNTPI